MVDWIVNHSAMINWNWIQSQQCLFWWLGAVSAFLFLITLVLIPFVAALIPEDYFAEDQRQPLRTAGHRHPVLHGFVVVLKNLLGLLLIVAGVIMLLIPGQGLLTIFAGFMLMNFPGKYKVERWLIHRGTVLRAVNWLRGKTNRPPLMLKNGSRTT